jgi:CRISPR-associated Csx2 family protein
MAKGEVQDMNKKKILILTLGVGNVFGRGQNALAKEEREQRLREMIKNKEYPYEPTKYVIQNEEVSSEYVAEIQIKRFQPDMVIIIGTVKSGWSMFYRKFTQHLPVDEIEENVVSLFHIEQDEQHGINTCGEKLKKLESEIQSIYNDKLKFPTDKKIDIKVCLIRYGINNSELMENYQYISGIEEYLEKGVEYEVAFDITHSFRSLPIYNLVVLNYLQNVSGFNMKISHIYYGNFDIRSEMGGKAPLVDLADIGEVLNLTNAVSEFKNTGNANSLINMLPESEGELRQALVKFDIATQLNGRNNVEEALRELSDILNNSTEARGRFVDAKKMLKAVLSDESNNLFAMIDCDSIGEKQLILTKWYQRQNRYGLAVATASETLRSFLVPFYLDKYSNGNNTCEDEGVRKGAVYILSTIRNAKDNWCQSPITDFLIELEEFRSTEIKRIRDGFAHNLSYEEDSDDTSIEPLEELEEVEALDSKDMGAIDKFIDMLDKLRDYIRNNKSEFEAVYCYELSKTLEVSSASGKIIGDRIRILVSEKYDNISDDEIKMFKTAGKGNYYVYKLPNGILQPDNNITDKKESFIHIVAAVGEYIKRHFDNTDKVHIVFDKVMEDRKWIYYSILLYNMGFNWIYYISRDDKLVTFGKPMFQINLDSTANYTYNEDIMQQAPELM